jgi:hypothetical protein
MGWAYRIRVYGKPHRSIDPHQFVQALLMLARELHEQELQDRAAADDSEASVEAGPSNE